MKSIPKSVVNHYIFALLLCAPMSVAIGQAPSVDAKAAADFEGRVREYTSRRKAIESKIPKLSKKASAEEIAAHKKALLQTMQAERRGIVRGTIFTPAAEQMVRSTIARIYKGRDRMELRKELAEAENAAVAVKVNAVYPESAELLEMPPTLLLALPQLPEQVRYRFVGTNLLLVDRENHLILDYMANALP